MKLNQRQNIFHVIKNVNSVVQHVIQIKNGLVRHVDMNVTVILKARI